MLLLIWVCVWMSDTEHVLRGRGSMCTFLRCIWEELMEQSAGLWEQPCFCGSRGFPLLQYRAACIRREGRREKKTDRHNRETESLLLPGNSGKTLSENFSIYPTNIIVHFPCSDHTLDYVTRLLSACFSVFVNILFESSRENLTDHELRLFYQILLYNFF